MTESFQLADWLVCGFAATMAVLGLFRGFSGTLGFFLGVVVAGFTASFGWPYSANFTVVAWQRGALVLVVTLVAFGLVRLCVKKLVNGLLSQPSDALFGFATGAAIGALALVGWAWSGLYLEYSYLATAVSRYL